MSGGKFWSGNSRGAKVTATDVINIRTDAAAGITQRELCFKYDLSIAQIGRIVRGESWRSVKMEASSFDINASARRMLEVQEEARAKSALEKMQGAVGSVKKEERKGDDMLNELTGGTVGTTS